MPTADQREGDGDQAPSRRLTTAETLAQRFGPLHRKSPSPSPSVASNSSSKGMFSVCLVEMKIIKVFMNGPFNCPKMVKKKIP